MTKQSPQHRRQVLKAMKVSVLRSLFEEAFPEAPKRRRKKETLIRLLMKEPLAPDSPPSSPESLPEGATCDRVSVSVGLTRAQRAALRREARERGESMSALMRGQLLEHADTLCDARLQDDLEDPFVPEQTRKARDVRQAKKLEGEQAKLERQIKRLDNKIQHALQKAALDHERARNARSQRARDRAAARAKEADAFLAQARKEKVELEAQCDALCKATTAFKAPCQCKLPATAPTKPTSTHKAQARKAQARKTTQARSTTTKRAKPRAASTTTRTPDRHPSPPSSNATRSTRSAPRAPASATLATATTPNAARQALQADIQSFFAQMGI